MAPLFKVAEKQNGAEQEFTLVPKNRKKNNSNKFNLPLPAAASASLAFEDKLGQTTRLTLSNTAANTPVDMAMFTFVPKPGTDVIEND